MPENFLSDNQEKKILNFVFGKISNAEQQK